MGAFGLTLPGVVSALGFMGIRLAFPGAPQLLTRLISARDQKQIVEGGFIAVLCVVGFDVGAAFSGMAGSERRLSLYGKLTTVVIGAGALVVALAEVRMVFWLVLFAWSALASAFSPVVLCSLFWKRTTRAGAIAGNIGGFVTTVAWVVFFKEGFYDLYEMRPGFAGGFLFTIGVSLLTDPPEGAAEEMAAVMEEVRTGLPEALREAATANHV